jgi:hypothetical protein
MQPQSRQIGLPFGGEPAQAQEHVRNPAVRHPPDLGGAERARRRGKQKVLRHDDPFRENRIGTVPDTGMVVVHLIIFIDKDRLLAAAT